MPRQARLDVPGVVHHVMGRGIEGCEIFRDQKDRESFLTRLAELVGPGKCRLYAWVLMSNHFHLLMRPEGVSLSLLMRRLMTCHAVRFNLRHGRKGHLFQNRYKSVIVEEEPYFLQLVRYIHLNPVRARMVEAVTDLDAFRYSGHAVVVGERDYPAQEVAEILGRFSPRADEALRLYRDFVGAGLKEGHREEFQGGGLVRSAGGVNAVLARKPEEREAADARILGAGEFVEEVWERSERPKRAVKAVEAVLTEVAKKTGVTREEIVGPSRARRAAEARRLFYLRAREESGASAASLARLTGRSHTAVGKALEQEGARNGVWDKKLHK